MIVSRLGRAALTIWRDHFGNNKRAAHFLRRKRAVINPVVSTVNLPPLSAVANKLRRFAIIIIVVHILLV